MVGLRARPFLFIYFALFFLNARIHYLAGTNLIEPGQSDSQGLHKRREQDDGVLKSTNHVRMMPVGCPFLTDPTETKIKGKNMTKKG